MITLQTKIQTPMPAQRSVAMGLRAVSLALLIAPLVGCGVTPAFAKEPLASRTIQVPAGTAASRLLHCAEKTVLSLSKTQSNWDERITLKDEAGGRFETGNFPDKNVMGFRVSLRFDASAQAAQAAQVAQVQLKGAGPYFVDLGVDGAIERFVQQTTACLSAS